LLLARIGRTLTQAHRLSADKRRKKDAESMKYAGYGSCPSHGDFGRRTPAGVGVPMRL